ncbi:MAG: nucleoside deaminase [Chloroflexota bacterium]
MNDAEFSALDHELYMREALREAHHAGQAGERPIGAVIVHQGTIVGRGRATHRERRSKIAHAETNALYAVEQYAYDHQHDGLILYTTVEPCVMCLGTIVMSEIDHIVYALPDRWIDPGQMLQIPYVRRHVKHYLGGVLEAESAALFEQYRPDELSMICGYNNALTSSR